MHILYFHIFVLSFLLCFAPLQWNFTTSFLHICMSQIIKIMTPLLVLVGSLALVLMPKIVFLVLEVLVLTLVSELILYDQTVLTNTKHQTP